MNSTDIVLTEEERNTLKCVIEKVNQKKEYDCFDVYALPEPVKMDFYKYQDNPVSWMNARDGKYFFDYWKQQILD